MIKPAPYNAIDFSESFSRKSIFFDPSLQRVKNLLSSTTGVLSFYFAPGGAMPESAPNMTLTALKSDGTHVYMTQTNVIEFTNYYIYRFSIQSLGLTAGQFYCDVQVAGYTDVIYSEWFEYVDNSELIDRNIVRLIAYNNDETRGYLTNTYPATAFFQVSELNNKEFGNSKTEYVGDYGVKILLDSENYIKTRYTFVGLSMYQRNLLKWLCNCQVFSINGTALSLISDFTEKSKDENNEIFDLQADFVEVAQSFFITGSGDTPNSIDQTNLFVR